MARTLLDGVTGSKFDASELGGGGVADFAPVTLWFLGAPDGFNLTNDTPSVQRDASINLTEPDAIAGVGQPFLMFDIKLWIRVVTDAPKLLSLNCTPTFGTRTASVSYNLSIESALAAQSQNFHVGFRMVTDAGAANPGAANPKITFNIGGDPGPAPGNGIFVASGQSQVNLAFVVRTHFSWTGA